MKPLLISIFINLIILCLSSSFLGAQNQLTTPLEILTFMEASPTKYELEQLYGEIPRKNRTIIPHGAYIEQINGKEHQREYKNTESEEETKWKLKARNIMSVEKPNYKKARDLYLKILKKNPQNAQIHTFIGETYYEQDDFKNAINWFQKAIALNPIDYLARWLSAEVHLKYNKIDSAIYAITLAHIYNRNHPRLLIRLEQMYKLHKKKYFKNWGFKPKMYIYKDGETVVVTADGIWLTYGMYKAVWNYDTDYHYIKEQQEITDYMFQQEMEATIGTYMTYSALKKDDKRNYPSMNAFGYCLDYEMVEEFVMYEIILVDTPTIAIHTTDAFMERLIEYINKVRSVNYAEE